MWDQLTALNLAQLSVFEIAMLLCFAASWPVSILRTLKVKNPAGKSYGFMLLVIIGYAAGALHKVLYKPDFVFWLYLFNASLVAIDLTLVVLARRRYALATENAE